MCKRSLIVCLAGVVVALVAAPSAGAFEYAGQAWCCDTVYYYINPANPQSACGNPIFGNWFMGLIQQAAASWNGQGTQFQLVFTDTTSVECEPYANNPNICAGILDGQNTVSMAKNCNWIDNSVLAFATWWYWLPNNGDTSCCIFEADICFNDNITWFNDQGTCSGSCYDLVSVATHEFGHWIAANHEPDDAVLGYRPVMFPFFNFCEMRRNITVDDATLLSWAYDPFGVIRLTERCDATHQHPPYPAPPPHIQCEQPPCPPGPAYCDSAVVDSCLLICPASDEVFTVTLKDSCGNPICDPTGTWLDFSQCPTVPCPDEEPTWPRVFPDSCNPNTGEHYFTVDASAIACDSPCEAVLFINGQPCRPVPARFFDNDGDGCVTNADFVGGRPCEDYNCNFASDDNDRIIFESHLGHCCGGACPPGPPFCDSTTYDPCLVVCPKSDIVYTVTTKDSCGNPTCLSPTGQPAVWLDFSQCPSMPCPDEEPNWPLVLPDSCDPATGKHYFTVDASLPECVDCVAAIVVNDTLCRLVPAKFLDINGDLCVTENDLIGPIVPLCNDYNCNGVFDAEDSSIAQAHRAHCCPGVKPPCCVGTVGNVNCDPLDVVDIADLTALIDHLFINFTPLCCSAEANCNGDPLCIVDIADLTSLIDFLFINFTPLPPCGVCP